MLTNYLSQVLSNQGAKSDLIVFLFFDPPPPKKITPLKKFKMISVPKFDKNRKEFEFQKNLVQKISKKYFMS